MKAQKLTPVPPPAYATVPVPQSAAANDACRSDRLWTTLRAQWLGLCRGRHARGRHTRGRDAS